MTLAYQLQNDEAEAVKKIENWKASYADAETKLDSEFLARENKK